MRVAPLGGSSLYYLGQGYKMGETWLKSKAYVDSINKAKTTKEKQRLMLDPKVLEKMGISKETAKGHLVRMVSSSYEMGTFHQDYSDEFMDRLEVMYGFDFRDLEKEKRGEDMTMEEIQQRMPQGVSLSSLQGELPSYIDVLNNSQELMA